MRHKYIESRSLSNFRTHCGPQVCLCASVLTHNDRKATEKWVQDSSVGPSRPARASLLGLNIPRKVTFPRKCDNEVTLNNLVSLWHVIHMVVLLLMLHIKVELLFSHISAGLLLSGSMKSGRGLQNQHRRLLWAVRERTTVSCNTQSDLKVAMPRPFSWPYVEPWLDKRSWEPDRLNDLWATMTSPRRLKEEKSCRIICSSWCKKWGALLSNCFGVANNLTNK